MNTEQIIQEEVENFVINTEYVLLADPLRHAIRQAIKREREACVEICVLTKKMCKVMGLPTSAAEACANAIRARGNK